MAVITGDREYQDVQVAASRQVNARDVVDGALVGLALLGWGLPVTHGSGGRAAWALAAGLALLLPAVLAVQPWRRLPGWQTLLALSPAAAAVVVCLTAPTGFDGLDELASFAYAGGLFLVVRAWADRAVRRQIALGAVALVGLEQFTQGYLPWWGSGSASTLMLGTFYWHNQFAAFMVGTGLVAAVGAVRGKGAVRTLGWAVAPWCIAGTLFSGSRAGMATFVASWAIVVAFSYRDRVGRIKVFGVLLAALALATFLTSPLLMETSGWFSAAVQARGAGSLETSGADRLGYWEAAVRLGLRHPWTGAGFDTFGSAGSAQMPAGSGMSSLVHNGYLQAFSDGGLVLLVTVALATGLPLVAAVRALLSRSARHEEPVLAVGVPVALLALVLHSGVDFDWAYPSLLALFAVLAALLPATPAEPSSGRVSRVALAALTLVLVVGAVPAALRATGLQAPEADVPAWAAPVAAVVPVHGELSWLPATGPCRDELGSGSASERARAIACTARAAADDPTLDLRRAAAEVRDGRRAIGVRHARRVVARFGDRRPMLRVQYAEVLALAGRVPQARAELADLQADLRAAGLEDDAAGVGELLGPVGS